MEGLPAEASLGRCCRTQQADPQSLKWGGKEELSQYLSLPSARHHGSCLTPILMAAEELETSRHSSFTDEEPVAQRVRSLSRAPHLQGRDLNLEI